MEYIIERALELTHLHSLAEHTYHIFKRHEVEKLVQKILNKSSLSNLQALDIFARNGESTTKYYSKFYTKHCSSLELWEIEGKHRSALEQRFPQAEVKIIDSFKQLRITDKKYSFITVDNPVEDYGENLEHSEHFDLFPDVFRVCADSTILIMDIIPYANGTVRRYYPKLFTEQHLARRASFYRTQHPEKLSLEEMVNAYRIYAEANGFSIDWHITQKRLGSIHLLALKINML